jgi:hypothetical protein
MKNNHKYFPEDKARKIIERHLEDAGIYNKAKIEKENDVFKIIFNTQDRNEAVKDALKLSMSLLEIESYSYKLLKYPVIFIHSNGIIANIHDMTAHDVIKDINRYLFGGKPRKNSNTRSIFKFYRGLIYSFAKPREALMRREAYYEHQNDLNISCGEYLASKHSIENLMKTSKLARSQTHQKKALPNEFFLVLILISFLGCVFFVEYKQLPTVLGSFWGVIGIGAVIHKNLIESTLPHKERISDIINIAIEESKNPRKNIP